MVLAFIFIFFSAGVPFLITAELFKQSHRPAAYTVGGSLNWISNFTIGFIFPFLQVLQLLKRALHCNTVTYYVIICNENSWGEFNQYSLQQ